MVVHENVCNAKSFACLQSQHIEIVLPNGKMCFLKTVTDEIRYQVDSFLYRAAQKGFKLRSFVCNVEIQILNQHFIQTSGRKNTRSHNGFCSDPEPLPTIGELRPYLF